MERWLHLAASDWRTAKFGRRDLYRSHATVFNQ